jgi:hypothetical protein
VILAFILRTSNITLQRQYASFLLHGYAELDHNKVYDIAVKHAPVLLSAVQVALKAFPDPTSK